ncbi:AP2 domain-containing protein [Nostoc sp. UIC 10630]|uniref:AP2 domain-containing protein n=1 Tax=Nostoc sp. UIC 10630 TaxID=2100146 RepID=UPI0013D5D9AC|nr:AP2 domain-containing protein [Nostoc sp. UIC 10630]NEU81481.1 hypothetical protein [Nostoc sp. UIC 10630]
MNLIYKGQALIIDECDLDILESYLCYWHEDGYLNVSNPDNNIKCAGIHRIIAKRMGLSLLGQIDHIDRCRYNNSRINLRSVSIQQNKWNYGKGKNNSTGYKGVSLRKTTGKYQAYIKKDGKRIHIGYFNDIVEAAKAYDVKAIELFGEYAGTNF